MCQDQLSGLILPNGTTLAPVGRRIGAFFLGWLLSIVTLGIGYIIWGAISWSKGQTPDLVLPVRLRQGAPHAARLHRGDGRPARPEQDPSADVRRVSTGLPGR
jgi:hypothetical protein